MDDEISPVRFVDEFSKMVFYFLLQPFDELKGEFKKIYLYFQRTGGRSTFEIRIFHLSYYHSFYNRKMMTSTILQNFDMLSHFNWGG